MSDINELVQNLNAEVERLNEAELLRATEMVKLEQRIGQQEAENKRLRKRGDILHEALVDIISHRCNGWNHACEIARKAMDDAMHAYAMGKD